MTKKEKSMMNKLLTNKISKLIALTVLLFSAFNVSAKVTSIKKLHLDRVTIKNDSGSRMYCELTWRYRHGAHNTLVNGVTVDKSKKQRAKGPLLGYGLKSIKVTPSSMVAASAAVGVVTFGVGGAMTAAFESKINANKNKFFVIQNGKKVSGTKEHKPEITGYKNEKAYNEAMAAKKAAENKSEIDKNKKISDEMAAKKAAETAAASATPPAASASPAVSATPAADDNEDDSEDSDTEDSDTEEEENGNGFVAAQ